MADPIAEPCGKGSTEVWISNERGQLLLTSREHVLVTTKSGNTNCRDEGVMPSSEVFSTG